MRRLASIALLLLAGCGGGAGSEVTEPSGDSGPTDTTPACMGSLTSCGGACVDVSNDDANCGACGNACPGSTHCAAGSCCPPPTILCGNACLDPREDDKNCGACGKVCEGSNHCADSVCQQSAIRHVVVIVQENHTFESYFGKYCKAPAGSSPTCTAGPDCCEGAPAKEPHGASPTTLDDSANFGSDHDHKQECEIQQIHGGKMDQFVTGSTGADTCLTVGPSCANAKNWALADKSTVGQYWDYADQYALADRYFQPIAGGSSSNDMYFAVAHFQFIDNAYIPAAIAAGCTDPDHTCINGKTVSYKGRKTIADVIMDNGKTFAAYMDGYAEAVAAGSSCADAPSYCPYSSHILHPLAWHACVYDTSDNPFVYYEQHANKPYIKDYNALKTDLDTNALPSFSFIKARAYHNEHPNFSTITDGVSFVRDTVQMIQGSSVADTTLILVTWDEGGGFFDHVAPPDPIDVDDTGNPVPYGTRVPLIAIGPFAKKGQVSHVTMEHSSIVRFLEWNFAGPVGQLGANDAKVNNIGSLLDRTKTGVHVPE